jgi:kanamycin kinase/aminoglycoside 3'-phosphotransferase-2
LKRPHPGDITPLAAEADRLRWLATAAPHLPIPRVIDAGRDDQGEWLLLAKLPGTDATDRVHWYDLDGMVTAMAEALRRIHHEVPVAGCPFDASPATLLAEARQRVVEGLVDREEFGPVHRRYSAADLFERLVAVPVPEPDVPVVCHGDYCVPNVLLSGGVVTGIVDWGRAGVGDRYFDLALAARSIVDNTGSPELAVRFLSAYGIDAPDGRKVDWFVLLDEFL